LTQKRKRIWTFTVRLGNATTHGSAGEVVRSAAGGLASLATYKGYNLMELRQKLCPEGVRSLIKHGIFQPIDHAHDARIDGPRYRQRATCEIVFSTLSSARSATPCVREFSELREFILMCAVHYIK
jgi:IS5 family transposase